MSDQNGEKNNRMASKINNAFDIVTGKQAAGKEEDKSYDVFAAIFYIIGFLFLASAVYVVVSNFGLHLWKWDYPAPVIKTCDEGLYLVGKTTIEVLILLLLGFTFVQGNDGEGEIRKSITISVMIMFYGLVAIHCNEAIDKGTIAGLVLDKFWAIVVTVTGYYFASRTAENIKGTKE